MKKINSFSLLIFCTLAVASCASLGKYKPVEKVADNLYGDCPTDTSSSNFANVKWQDVFTDAKLQKLIDTALLHSLDYQLAFERITEANEYFVGAGLAFTPTLGLEPSILSATPSKFSEFSMKDYNFDLNASWQLSIFRGINNRKSAGANKEQMIDYCQAVRSSLVGNVANTYYTILMLDAQLQASMEMEKSWVASVETITILKQAGLADQVAVEQYKANLENIRITLKDLQNQLVKAENAMRLYMGVGNDYPIDRSTLGEQKVSESITFGSPVQLLTFRPDVRAAQRSLELAYYAKRGAILNFFPTLSITGSLGYSNTFGVPMSLRDILLNVSSNLVAPIFNAGVNRTQLKVAESQQRQAKIEFDKVILNAGVEVNNAYHDYQSYSERSQQYAKRVASLDKARKDTEYLMLNSFDKTYLDVLFANTNYFEATLGAISNEKLKLQSVVSIYTSLGGGAF